MFQSLLWWIAVVNWRIGHPQHAEMVPVSILVVVDCSRQQSSRKIMGRREVRFQSLLWWIAVVNFAIALAVRPLKSCFNPCCGGLQSSTGPRFVEMGCGYRFQSLLWWIAVVNETGEDTGGNPYMFQSLLWWIAVSTASEGRRGREGSQFQSLLWWIAVVNRKAPSCTLRSTSFNPCCGGLQSSTVRVQPDGDPVVSFNPCCGGLQSSTRGRCTTAARIVSILVVVDCSRQPAIVSMTLDSGAGDVSILVVVDCSRQRVR